MTSTDRTELQRATQEDFDQEVRRVQGLLEHLQQHAAQLKEVVTASPEAAEKLHRAETLLEQAEAVLEETQKFHE